MNDPDELEVGLYEAVKMVQALERLTGRQPVEREPDVVEPDQFMRTLRVHCEVPDSVAVFIAATCRRNRKAS